MPVWSWMPLSSGFLALIFVIDFGTVDGAGSVIGIDIGSENLKIGIVRPGSGVEIVLNEQTARKTPVYVGFRGAERYFGIDAFNLHTRFPSNMIPYLKHLCGVLFSDTADWQQRLMFPYLNFSATERGTVQVALDKDVFSAEELLAMFFVYIKTLSENHAGMAVTDCVITVPAAFSMRQRQSLIDSATLANLNVLSLMHDTTAAVLQFGIQNRRFKDTDTHVAIFDMGASQLEVGIYTFHPPSNHTKRKAKKEESLGRIFVRGIVSDKNSGGRYFDAIIARLLAAEYKTKHNVDILSLSSAESDRAVAKLLRAAKKSKETLSANKDCRVSVEGIWEERDFNTKLSRATFEESTGHLSDNAVKTLAKAIAKANLTLADIDSVELMGGATRVPALQEKLQAYYGKPLGRSMNTDESSVMGATFHAARLSGSFRVRSFAFSESSLYTIAFALSADDATPSPVRRPLFVQSKLPSKKLVTIFRNKNFNITLYFKQTSETGEDIYTPISEYVLDGVASAFNKLGVFKSNASPASKHSLEIKFLLSEFGVVSLESATARYEEEVNATKRVKRNVTSTNATLVNASSLGENATNTSSVNRTKPKDEYDIVSYTKIVSHRDSLTTEQMHILKPNPMPESEFLDAKSLLAKLKARDAAKREVAEARNSLEEFIYSTKSETFLENEDLMKFLNATELTDIKNSLEATQDWLEQEEGSTLKDYRKKLRQLKGLTEPVHERRRNAQRMKEEKDLNDTLAAEADISTNANSSSTKSKSKEQKDEL